MIRFPKAILFCTSTVILSLSALLAQEPLTPVSPGDIIAMSGAGLSDQIIIAKIHAHNKPADVSTQSLLDLKKAKVSDAVIAALMDPAAVPAAATSITVSHSLLPSSSPSGATTGPTGDPNEPMSPHESGIWVYTKDHDGKQKMIELEKSAYQGAHTGGLFTSGLTYGIVKAKSKAIIAGSAAGIRVGEPLPVFYFYFENKAGGIGGNAYFAAQNISSPNQFALIQLEVEKNSRSAEIGEFSIWGATSGNNKKKTVTFKSERVKPGLYRVTVDQPMKAGEYCFLTAPVVTSSYAGVAGTSGASNIFDFGLDK